MWASFFFPSGGVSGGNSGSGGNGGNCGHGGNGGKGIVIIRYAGAVQLATGGTVSTPSGYVVHTFTGDGTFVTNLQYSIN